MKRLLILPAFCALLLFSCDHKSTTEQAKTDTAKLNYPFPHKYPINWQPGDEKNAVTVLNALKKYVAGDLPGTFEPFADSVEFIGDQFYFKGKKDSLIKIFTQIRGDMTSISKDFDTWMTLYYPDKKETWVTLWYTEKWTDKKGKTDSLYYTDDVMFKDGKIHIYDEKIRRFPEPPAKK